MNLHESCLCNLVPQASKDDLNAFFRDETRGIVYSLLSAAFRDEPSKNLLDYIKSNTDQVIDFFNLYNKPQSAQFIQGWKQLTGYDAHNRGNLLPLRKEFGLLFLNPRGVHPFESVYRSSKKQLMDKPWVLVKNFYQSTGMIKGDNEEHLEDHASVELGFMAHLALMSAQASNEDPGEALNLLKIQEDFLSRHLLCWFPDLCRDIQARESAPFYHIISRIGKSWVAMDHQFLKYALDQ